MTRDVTRVFGARGADFRLAPPPLPPKKICNSPNQIKFLVGRLLLVGDHLDQTFPYFWKILSVFC